MTVIHVLIIYDVPSWCYHRRAMALQKFAPVDMTITICEYAKTPYEAIFDNAFDVVLSIDYSVSAAVKDQMHAADCTTPFVSQYNQDGLCARRMKPYRRCLKMSDFVIFNCIAGYNYRGIDQKTCAISNGVDLDMFRPKGSTGDRSEICCWTGSTNPKKGKGYKDVLIPLRQMGIKNGFIVRLHPIDTIRGNPDLKTTEQMVEWYNEASVVLVSSTSDATPNHLLEAAACGVVPVSNYIGNLTEFGTHGHDCVIVNRRAPEEYVPAIKEAMEHRDEMGAAVRQTLIDGGWHWRDRSRYFYSVFRKLAQGELDAMQPFSYCDVTPEDIDSW